ncbi:MAG: hypothetical protein SFU25_00690 [Candidatus Caenarcaniphilales bacterium]|nr:hypothetical protein [Candidatus Caenarcaniphilales bacterium]
MKDVNKKANHSNSCLANCPRCASVKIVKNGYLRGEQRWKCKDCSFQFTQSDLRNRPLEMKLMSVLLYLHGMSLRNIALHFDVSPQAVLDWVNELTVNDPIYKKKSTVLIDEIEEIWHYSNDEKQNIKSGEKVFELKAEWLVQNTTFIVSKKRDSPE